MSNRWQNTIPRCRGGSGSALPLAEREAERVSDRAVTPQRAEELKAAWRKFAAEFPPYRPCERTHPCELTNGHAGVCYSSRRGAA